MISIIKIGLWVIVILNISLVGYSIYFFSQELGSRIPNNDVRTAYTFEKIGKKGGCIYGCAYLIETNAISENGTILRYNTCIDYCHEQLRI